MGDGTHFVVNRIREALCKQIIDFSFYNYLLKTVLIILVIISSFTLTINCDSFYEPPTQNVRPTILTSQHLLPSTVSVIEPDSKVDVNMPTFAEGVDLFIPKHNFDYKKDPCDLESQLLGDKKSQKFKTSNSNINSQGNKRREYVPLKYRTKTLKDLKIGDSTEMCELIEPSVAYYENKALKRFKQKRREILRQKKNLERKRSTDYPEL